MIKIDDLIDLYDDFFKTDQRLPKIVPKSLKGSIMKWEYPEEFSDKVNTWKQKKKVYIAPSKDDIDRYWLATELALTLTEYDRNLVYDRHRGNSYRKLGKLYNTSHEKIRLDYLTVLFMLQTQINSLADGNIKKYIYLKKN